MFGTLVIALPSKHEGGEVRVTHGGITRIFDTSKSSEINASFLAWCAIEYLSLSIACLYPADMHRDRFSDVTHEVKPVTSGRRLVLTYNLLNNMAESKELTANSNQSLDKLRSLLPLWKDKASEKTLPLTLAYMFQHEYTDANLRYNNLKCCDRRVASSLRQVCNELDVCLYFASVQREILGDCDSWRSNGAPKKFRNSKNVVMHTIYEVIERETSLTRVVDIYGTLVGESIKFDDTFFASTKPFDDRNPDDEEYSGYTGNEGVSATHFYRRTVALMIPKTDRLSFFFESRQRLEVSYGDHWWGPKI